jgi:predicted hydrocarbon binding protein
MNQRLDPEETTPPEPAQEPGDGFRPDLPLAILESVRHHDRPMEVLEDEDLAASLPRRLGLTGVVESQIHRYRIARKRRERVSAADVVDLLRLVMRRPDCEPILREAGHDLARHHHRKILYRLSALARVLPEGFGSWVARRGIHALMRRIGGPAFRTRSDPFGVEARGAVTARADPYGVACVLYAAATEEAYHQATGRRPAVAHPECEARGDDRCLWTVE